MRILLRQANYNVKSATCSFWESFSNGFDQQCNKIDGFGLL